LIRDDGKQHGVFSDGDGIGIDSHMPLRSIVKSMPKIERIGALSPGPLHLLSHLLGGEQVDLADLFALQVRIAIKGIGSGISIQNGSRLRVDEKHGKGIFCKEFVAKKALRGDLRPLLQKTLGVIQNDPRTRRKKLSRDSMTFELRRREKILIRAFEDHRNLGRGFSFENSKSQIRRPGSLTFPIHHLPPQNA
jgi:hypothetical protein